MELIKYLKSSLSSVIPFFAVLLLSYFLLLPPSVSEVVSLVISTAIMIVGMIMFFPGLKASIEDGLPLLTDNLIEKHSKAFLFVFMFLLCFVATLSEPNVIVFALQFASMVRGSSAAFLTLIVAFSCSLFFIFSILRLLLHIPMRLVFLVFYVLFFVVVSFMDDAALSIALDSGGAATGLITVPFISLFGLTFASHLQNSKDSDKFGFSGISSLGVLLFVVLYLCFTPISTTSTEVVAGGSLFSLYINSFLSTLKMVNPFALLYLVSELFLLKHRGFMLRSKLFGFVFMVLGVMLLTSSATVVYIPFVEKIAEAIAQKGKWFTVLLGALFGLLSAFLEPSVMVLAKNIEKELNGRVSHILIVAAVGVALAFTMICFLIRVYHPFNIKVFFIAVYAVILILMFFTDSLFVGIAFDAGAAGAGLMSGVILLPYVLKVAFLYSSSSLSGFGVIGGVVAFPILITEILGIVYRYKVTKRGVK